MDPQVRGHLTRGLQAGCGISRLAEHGLEVCQNLIMVRTWSLRVPADPVFYDGPRTLCPAAHQTLVRGWVSCEHLSPQSSGCTGGLTVAQARWLDPLAGGEGRGVVSVWGRVCSTGKGRGKEGCGTGRCYWGGPTRYGPPDPLPTPRQEGSPGPMNASTCRH
jgi:hypothetical protein